jgi:hypothetical protein
LRTSQTIYAENIMNKTKLASGLLGTLSFLALLGCAQASFAARLVDVTVVNRNTGERLTPYRYDGKLYVAGTPGDRYAIELKSKRGERVLTVLSVDGVNVLTGQTAATLQSGYVVDGWQSYSISGWRKNMDDVAQFVFTALPNSYAARTGRPDNVGVIGVAVYREKVVPPPQPVAVAPLPTQPWREEYVRRSLDDAARQAAPAPAPAAKAEAASGNLGKADQAESRVAESAEVEKKAKRLGTGHGEREYSPTRYTEFVRNSDSPDEVITIYYDSRANLVARGIIPSSRLAEPTPFPAGVGFVPDPRG